MVGISHIGSATILFHSDFESSGFHSAREIKPKTKTIELLSHPELDLWWPSGGGQGILCPEFPEHRESFQYKSRKGRWLKGVTGISKSFDKWTSVCAWGLAEWYAGDRVIQARTRGKIKLDPNKPISGTHSALIQTDFDSSAVLRHPIMAPKNGRLIVRFAIRFPDDLTGPWNGTFPLLQCGMNDRLSPHVAMKRPTNESAIQFSLTERPFVKFVRHRHSNPIPIAANKTYDVETQFEPVSDSVYVCSLRINGVIQSVVTSLHQPFREKDRYWVALGKTGDRSYPVCFWLDDIYVSDTPIGRIPKQPVLSCSSGHLIVVPNAFGRDIARAAHWQISADHSWLLPAFSSGEDPLHVRKLPPLESISLPRTAMAKYTFESSVPLPFDIPESSQYWARLRHRNSFGVWGPWSLPLDIPPKWVQAGQNTGMPKIDDAYFTQPGRENKLKEIRKGRWYDLHFRFPPAANPSLLDACLSGDLDAPGMNHYDRGGVFRSQSNYFVSLDLAHKTVWTAEDEGSTRHIMLLGDSAKYVDDTQERSLWDSQGGKARVRVRLLKEAKSGTWKLLARMASTSKGISPAYGDLFYVANPQAPAPSTSTLVYFLAIIGGASLAAGFMIGLLLLVKRHARTRREAFASIGLSAPADQYQNEHIQKSIEYIEGNLSRPISVGEVANAVGISPGRLSVIFRDETGSNVLGFIHAAKIKEAQRMLRESNLTANEIAFKAGFNTATSFNRTFKRYVGTTPLAYRETHK